jgi:pyruvate formate lyase activating enzyme
MKTAVLIGQSRHRINVDGAGVTTLVAFNGCPLNCKYCLNPQALSPKGVWKRLSPEELFRAVSKDDLYFRATGGGVTFGGGEPLISCREILLFRNICMNHGKKWKFNIESSLNVPNVIVEVIEKAIDHWIVDIKDMNPAIYKAYTGKDNDSVIRNLQYLINKNAKVTVRVPIIPGFNTESDMEKSILTLQQMGITDIERFTYTIREH